MNNQFSLNHHQAYQNFLVLNALWTQSTMTLIILRSSTHATDDPVTLSANTCVASACCINSNMVASLDAPFHAKHLSESRTLRNPSPLTYILQTSQLIKKILHTFLQEHRSVFASDLKEFGQCSIQPLN